MSATHSLVRLIIRSVATFYVLINVVKAAETCHFIALNDDVAACIANFCDKMTLKYLRLVNNSFYKNIHIYVNREIEVNLLMENNVWISDKTKEVSKHLERGWLQICDSWCFASVSQSSFKTFVQLLVNQETIDLKLPLDCSYSSYISSACAMLKTNKKTTTFNIYGVDLVDRDVDSIANMLKYNNTLEYMTVSCASDYLLDRLKKVFTYNTRVKRINVWQQKDKNSDVTTHHVWRKQ